jgi:energy-coupling factor transporter ATP-binding protein EcfA2
VSKNYLPNGHGGEVLEVEDLSVRLPGEARPVLDNLDLRLAPGEVMGIAGRSGSGKSTLIDAVSGLVPWLHPAEVHGDVRLGGESLTELDPGQRAHLLATCLDRPDAQLFLPTVRQEMAAAHRLHGDSEVFDLAARRLGVDRLMDRHITTLSSGQRQRVALTVALAASPRPVLIDEPTAHLDSDGARGLVDVLTEGRRSGGSFLLSEQAGWRIANGVGSWSRLDGGRLVAFPTPRRLEYTQPTPAGRAVVLATRGLAVDRGGQRLLEDVDLEIRAGEIVVLTGANGAGKSTLAYVLAGLLKADAGALTKSGRVALMLPSAELQLFAGTVAGEVAAADRTHAETARVLRRHRLEHLAARAPWTLSRGERQRLVHAALDLQRPELMIVDEPGQGLDPEDLAAFVHLMHRRAEKGRAYLVISHRRELLSAAHRHLRIEGGRIEETAP